MIDHDIKEQIFSFADKYQIERIYLLALVKTESDFNPLAQRYEPGYPYLYSVKELCEIVGCSRSTMEAAQRTSYGLTQVMGAVAYEYGFREWPAELFKYEYCLEYACKHTRRLNDKFEVKEKDFETSYAAYNAGRPRKVEGRWVNASAVSRFLEQLSFCSEFL